MYTVILLGVFLVTLITVLLLVGSIVSVSFGILAILQIYPFVNQDIPLGVFLIAIGTIISNISSVALFYLLSRVIFPPPNFVYPRVSYST